MENSQSGLANYIDGPSTRPTIHSRIELEPRQVKVEKPSVEAIVNNNINNPKTFQKQWL